MDDASATQPSEPGTTRSSHDKLIDAFYFKRDLDQVHLLLDHISGRPDRNLASLRVPDIAPQHRPPALRQRSGGRAAMAAAPGLGAQDAGDTPPGQAVPEAGADRAEPAAAAPHDAGAAAAGAPRVLEGSAVVERISLIRFPPDGPPGEKASDAAFLVMAKDALSVLAAPARPLTIAYTAMFVRADEPRWIGRRSLRADQPSGTGAAASHRVALAENAFPELKDHAAWFRWWFVVLLIFTLVWFIWSAVTYWDVAYGRSILQRIDQIHRDRLAGFQTNPALVLFGTDKPAAAAGPAGHAAPAETTGRAGSTGPTGSTVTTETAGAASSTGPAGIASKGPAGSDRQAVPASAVVDPCQRRDEPQNAFACWRLTDLAGAERIAVNDLDKFVACQWPCALSSVVHPLRWSFALFGIHPPSAAPAADGTAGATKNINEQSMASFLAVNSTYVLPTMFGVLGALISAFRSVGRQVRASLLSPRDLVMIWLTFPLGVVAGVAVGLFYSPVEGPQNGTGNLAANLAMTPSGLGFLAGYAAETFFNSLDEISRKVFPGVEETAAAAAAPHAPAPAAGRPA